MKLLEKTTIRPFTEADYDAVVAIHNRLEPDYVFTVPELRSWDANRAPKLGFRRFVLEHQGKVIGQAEFSRMSGMYHPQKFIAILEIQPEFQRQGFGAQLYSHMVQELAVLEAILLRARARADRPASLRFLNKRDFVEESRDWESRLDPTRVRLEGFEGALQKVHDAGIQLISLKELMHTDPDHRRKFYDLDMLTSADEPRSADEVFTPSDFADWQKRIFDDLTLLPEATLFALVNGDYIGFSQIWNSQTEGSGIYNGMTGVHPDWRRQGIALALKVQNLKWARSKGYRLIKTWNNSSNRGMLSINERLGFEKQPAWINYKKTLGEHHEPG